MLDLYRNLAGDRMLHVVATERADGDQRPDRDRTASDVAARTARQRLLTGHRWTMAAEEHGVEIVDADDLCRSEHHSEHHSERLSERYDDGLRAGDVLVTAQTDLALALWAADCAPIVLCGRGGTLVAAHAGWRGLAAGVIDVAVGELTAHDDRAIAAVLGPCIHRECYEFGASDLDAVATGVGSAVDRISSTVDGRHFLDVPAAVAAALGRWDVELDVVGPCTSCDDRWFSHRSRLDDGRHAVVAWTTAA